MPTAASAYRKRGLASAGRGPVDPRDIVPNLHSKSKPSTKSKGTRSGFPFLRKNSGGLAVGLLAVASSAAGNTAFARKGSSSGGSISGPSSGATSRRNSLTNVFEEDSNKFGEIVNRLSSSAASVKAKAKNTASALSSLPSPSEKGAAFLAHHRSRRRGSCDDRSVISSKSVNKSSHGFNKSSHGLGSFGVSLEMKRAAIQKSALSIKRSFTGTSMSMAESNAVEEAAAACSVPMANFFQSFHHSFLEHLSPESPHNLEKSLGMQSKLGNRHPGRPVYNGHYVRVRPTPLKNPKLVIHSEEMANDLGLGNSVESEVFLKYFSGDIDGAAKDGGFDADVESWATPYALSIMGRRYTNNVRVYFSFLSMCLVFDVH